LKVGIIGVGYWGKKHADEYSKLGHEVIVSDLSEKNLEFCKINVGAKITKDYHEILNNDEINAVSICTPNHTHYKFAIEALNAKKNILLEKPISINSTEADKIIRLAEKNGLVLLVGHIFRFNNAIQKLKEIIQNKQLGKIYTINIVWSNLEPVFLDRDILFDLGVHPLDIIDNIFGKTPKNISCIKEGFRQNNAEFAQINFSLDGFDKKNTFVNIDLSWLNPIRRRRIEIVGSEKTVIVDCVMQKIELIDNSSDVSEQIPIIPNNTIKDELRFFLEYVKSRKSIPDNAPNGKVAKRIIETIEKAKNFNLN